MTRLTEVFRQAEKSRIVSAAVKINKGEFPEFERDAESDFHFISIDNPERSREVVLQLVRERIPQRFALDPVRDIQVLCPMHRGTLGTHAFNEALKAALNPEQRDYLDFEGRRFSRGDKVMKTANSYDKQVFNGDMGFVTGIERDEERLDVKFDGLTVTLEGPELRSLSLAYATSIHKAQGSEYPAVVIPLSAQHFPMLQRNLLYTAVTRGKALTIIVGERRAIEIAVRNTRSTRRWTTLGTELVAPRIQSRPMTNGVRADVEGIGLEPATLRRLRARR